MVICFVYGYNHNSLRESCIFYTGSLFSTHEHGPYLPVYTAVFTACVYVRLHGPWPCAGGVHGVCGPCPRPCTHVHDHIHDCVDHVQGLYLRPCTRPCTRTRSTHIAIFIQLATITNETTRQQVDCHRKQK